MKRWNLIVLAGVLLIPPLAARPAIAQDTAAESVAAEDTAAEDTTAKLAVPEQVLQAQQRRIAAIEKAVPTAVSVFVPGGAGGGSGVLISPDGYALTNFHVSSPAGVHMRCGLADGNVYDAVIIGIDPVGDLALIRLLGRDDFPAATLGDSDKLQVGDWCFVVGNPFLLASNLQPTVTWGIISGVRRYQYPSGTLLEYANCIQTDASINPGNSGGPIYDADGRLIGIVGRASFEKRGRVNVGVGYAISINQAKNFVGYLHSGRIVDHATLGATVVTGEDGGAVVSNILESSDAFRRGLRYGDEILELAGQPILTANDFKNVLGTLPKNWRVPLVFRHEGQTIETIVRLPGVHLEDELLEKMAGALPPPPPRPAPKPEPKPTPEPEQPDEDAPDQPGDAEAGDNNKKLPAAVDELYADRRGYANYHPNLQYQAEIWKAIQAVYPAATDEQVWRIKGVTEQGRKVEITVGDSVQLLKLGKTETNEEMTLKLDKATQWYEAVENGSPTAILTALRSLKRLRELGPQQYGDTYYLGTMPLLGQWPLRDVLVATAGDIETRFLLHDDRLESIEAFAGRDADPAELLLRWPADKTDSPLPATLELRFGTTAELTLQLESWTTGPAPVDTPAAS
ncbi:S1C family serine protease [Roseimaritima ulvae]|uniref:Serine protease HtrA n=1 Tax=Roseimaritima ulvae TaxID=980254 RepID=A0A5B9R573_9BACT|nr:trypsin-like peptidase domain-containing protein [Roseimaritima ulvae]QEG41631.1 Putative serine protease HtrA [Roseimaritima ulvae]